MRKTLRALGLFLLAPACLSAQIRVAITAGGHISNVLETNNLSGWDSISSHYKARTGFHGGFIADIPFSTKSPLSFQPGIIYYNKGRDYNQVFDTTNTIRRIKRQQYVNYVHVPMNLVLKIGKKTKFILGGGPYVDLFFSGKETEEVYTLTGLASGSSVTDLPVGDKPGQYRVIHYGVNGLAGFEFGRVFLTANYSRGMSDFYSAKTYTGTFRNETIGGTLGIFLGKPVSIAKKPKDRDKDGVPDNEDACPDQPGTALTNGCPDTDGDGIADKDDQCPGEAGTKANHGCPLKDSDNDGIMDDKDKCPNLAGVARYNGCPVPDSDHDGISDEDDKCPDKPGVARYGGCPVPDRDGDGINDEEDKCPELAGVADKKGCPAEVKKEIVEQVNMAARKIQFVKRKADLTAASQNVLDDLAVVLNQHPELKLQIDGHSSSDGVPAFNQKLSEDRAYAVKAYLAGKNVDESRMNATGWGSSKPLVPNTTEANRIKNRRVEIQLSY